MKTIDIISSDEIKPLRVLLQPWIVCFTAALFFFFEFTQINMFNAISPGLMQTFHVQAVEVAHLSATYFYANVLFLFIAGIVLDHFSTRKILMIAMGWVTIVTVCFALSSDFWQAMVCRFITGIAGSFCFLSCVRLASRWFPTKRLALVVGLIVTMAMCGGLFAQTPFTLAADFFGWRKTLLLDAGLGFIIWLLIAFNIKDYPPQYAFSNSAVKLFSFVNLLKSLNQVIRNPQNWLGGVYTCLMNLPIFLLGALWGNLYLVQARQMDRIQASWIISSLFLGFIIGSPIAGWLSDWLGKRRVPMLVGGFLALALMCYLIFAGALSFVQLNILFFVMGFISSAQIISYPLIAESNPPAEVASAEGVAATIIMAGGFFQAVFAWVMNWHWNHQVVNALPIYSAQDYKNALMMIAILFAVAILAAFLVKENYKTFKA